MNHRGTQIPRILPTEGATNFRELGGYPVEGGRHVKYGMFYRGGALYALKSDRDKATLESMALKLVLDFRSIGECEAAPDWVPKGAKYQRINAMYYSDGSELDFSPAGMERVERELSNIASTQPQGNPFARFYARMPFGNPAYRAMFDALEHCDVPILFHCTAGKDRTGVAAMLILLALGADRETVIADYLETNRCRAAELEALRHQHRGLWEKSPEQWEMAKARYGVLPLYADTALDAILSRYGSWEVYFREEYGLNSGRLMALRNNYLE